MSGNVPINWVLLSQERDTRLLCALVPGGYLYRQDTYQGQRIISSSIAFVPREVLTVHTDGGKNMLVVMSSDGKNLGPSEGGN